MTEDIYENDYLLAQRIEIAYPSGASFSDGSFRVDLSLTRGYGLRIADEAPQRPSIVSCSSSRRKPGPPCTRSYDTVAPGVMRSRHHEVPAFAGMTVA